MPPLCPARPFLAIIQSSTAPRTSQQQLIGGLTQTGRRTQAAVHSGDYQQPEQTRVLPHLPPVSSATSYIWVKLHRASGAQIPFNAPRATTDLFSWRCRACASAHLKRCNDAGLGLPCSVNLCRQGSSAWLAHSWVRRRHQAMHRLGGRGRDIQIDWLAALNITAGTGRTGLGVASSSCNSRLCGTHLKAQGMR